MTKSARSGSRWLWCLLLSFLLLINCSIAIKADVQEASTIWNDTDLQIVGTLTYMGSSTGYQPVVNLSGTHGIEFCKEAESSLIKDPYLTSVSQQTLSGVLDEGYNVSYDYGTYLLVSQELRTANASRVGTAYYRVSVDRIDTQLLYRPQRAERTSGIIVGGIVIIGLYNVLRWIRK